MTKAPARMASASPELLTRARGLLEKAQTLPEILNIRNMAGAAEKYFRAAVHTRAMAFEAAEIRLRAERKAGQVLMEMKERGERDAGSGGDRTARSHHATVLHLADLDINKSQSSRWQEIASVPDPLFEQYIQEGHQRENHELTTAGLKAVAKIERKDEQIEAIRRTPPLPQGPFSVIVIDPPWPYAVRARDGTHRAGNPYPDMSLTEIKALPVDELADRNCIVWLWTTNAFLRVAFECLDAWEVEFKTMLTWVKDRMGLGDWLRGQTEHCMLAARGKPIRDLTNQTTVLQAPVREHSRKPEEFYALVEALCPSSKAELFARSKRAGWFTWGAERERFKS